MHLARIHLWGELVGALVEDSDTQTSTFEYSPEWIKKGIEISPIHLPLKFNKFQFQRTTHSAHQGLPPAFADALMAGFSQTVTDQWLASAGKMPATNSSLAYLLLLGQQGLGAIEFLAPTSANKGASKKTPNSDDSVTPTLVTLDDLATAAEQISLSNPGIIKGFESLAKASFMLRGSQPKVAVAIHKESGQMFAGVTAGADEYDHYIVKLGSQNQDTAVSLNAIEYAYQQMAQACDINLPSSELIHENERTHLMVKRFDRNTADKEHVQSFSALTDTEPFNAQQGYEDVFALMRELRLDKDEALQMLRRMVFNVIACNHNDHGRSINFTMNKAGDWRLAPACGLTYCNRLGVLDSHQLHVNHQHQQITREDLLAVVPSLRSEADQIINTIAERVSAWPLFARQAGINREQMTSIQRNHLLDL